MGHKSESSASDATEPEVLMIDATDLKAHSTASSLNKGGMSSKLHGVCHSKGGPLRLYLPEGQCSDFTGADGVLKDLPACGRSDWRSRVKIRKMLAQQSIPPHRCRKKVDARRVLRGIIPVTRSGLHWVDADG